MTQGRGGRHRRSIRLEGFDYAQAGAYFVTICAQDRACLFGEIVDARICLTTAGEIVRDEWFLTAIRRPCVQLDDSEFVIMPNHVHGIVRIVDAPDSSPEGTAGGGQVVVADRRGAARCAPTGATTGARIGVLPRSLGAIVRAFKAATARRINEARGMPGAKVWQRGFYEQIVRNGSALRRIRDYIATNPARWDDDTENPAHRSGNMGSTAQRRRSRPYRRRRPTGCGGRDVGS